MRLYWVLWIALTGCSQANQARELSPADSAAIRATTDRWLTAVRAGKWDDAAATFTEDATLWIAGTPYQGRAAIRQFHATMPPWNSSRVLHIDDIRGAGDIAYVVGHATVIPDGGGEPVIVSRTLDVRVRQGDGTWLFLRDMVTPIPQPTPTR